MEKQTKLKLKENIGFDEYKFCLWLKKHHYNFYEVVVEQFLRSD